TGGLYRRFWLPMFARDVVVVFGTLLTEPRSLPAFWHLGRCLPRALRQRREIMKRRRVSDEILAQWFSFHPAAEPVPEAAMSAAVGTGELIDRVTEAPIY